MTEFELTGKVAIVTGSGPLSMAAASALAEAGAELVLAGEDISKAEGVDKLVAGLGKRPLVIPTALTEPESLRELAQKAVSTLGKVDVLVNGASKEFAKPCLEITQAEWQAVLQANLTAVFLACQAVGQYMLGAKAGTIINLVSGLSARGAPNYSAYCAAMGGVHQLSRALALEWVRQGVRVNCIATGWFLEEAAQGEREQALRRYIPLKRFGQPGDIGGLVVYLASHLSEHIVGQTYFIDGGLAVRP